MNIGLNISDKSSKFEFLQFNKIQNNINYSTIF